jgi:hypothetical protein
LETELRELAPAVFSRKWCGQPDLHRHRLIGTQASWLLDDDRKMERRGHSWPAPLFDKKEQTPLPAANG